MDPEKTLYEKRSAKRFLLVYRQLEPGTPWELLDVDPHSTDNFDHRSMRAMLEQTYRQNLHGLGFTAAQVRSVFVPRGTTIPTVTDTLDVLTKEVPHAHSS